MIKLPQTTAVKNTASATLFLPALMPVGEIFNLVNPIGGKLYSHGGKVIVKFPSGEFWHTRTLEQHTISLSNQPN